MASSTSRTRRLDIEDNVKLSPRETGLLGAFPRPAVSLSVNELVMFEFDVTDTELAPLHAKQIIRAAMDSIGRKLKHARSKWKLTKIGNGGRAGIFYQFQPRGQT